MNAHDAVGQGHDRAFGARLGSRFKVLDFLLDQVADLGRVQLHYRYPRN